MALTYMKVFYDWLEAMEPLADDERGRLFTALLQYARSGNVPDLRGNERFLFPVLRAQLDRDAAAYAAQCQTGRENGRLGGRPRKNPPGFSKTQDKDKNKEKDNDYDEDSRRGSAPAAPVRRKRPPPARAGTISQDMDRMERFLLQLRREAVDKPPGDW